VVVSVKAFPTVHGALRGDIACRGFHRSNWCSRHASCGPPRTSASRVGVAGGCSHTLSAVRCLGTRKHGQQQAREESDDGTDHEQLHQRERATGFLATARAGIRDTRRSQNPLLVAVLARSFWVEAFQVFADIRWAREADFPEPGVEAAGHEAEGGESPAGRRSRQCIGRSCSRLARIANSAFWLPPR